MKLFFTSLHLQHHSIPHIFPADIHQFPQRQLFPLPLQESRSLLLLPRLRRQKHLALRSRLILLVCNDAFSPVCLKSLCRRRDQRVWRSAKRHDHRIRIHRVLRARYFSRTSSSRFIRLSKLHPKSLAPVTRPLSLTSSSVGFCRRSKIIPSSFA